MSFAWTQRYDTAVLHKVYGILQIGQNELLYDDQVLVFPAQGLSLIACLLSSCSQFSEVITRKHC